MALLDEWDPRSYAFGVNLNKKKQMMIGANHLGRGKACLLSGPGAQVKSRVGRSAMVVRNREPKFSPEKLGFEA